MRLIKGETKREKIEDFSYLTMIASAIMIFFGILLGSFVGYTVFIGAFGALTLIFGIILYIISQFME